MDDPARTSSHNYDGKRNTASGDHIFCLAGCRIVYFDKRIFVRQKIESLGIENSLVDALRDCFAVLPVFAYCKGNEPEVLVGD